MSFAPRFRSYLSLLPVKTWADGLKPQPFKPALLSSLHTAMEANPSYDAAFQQLRGWLLTDKMRHQAISFAQKRALVMLLSQSESLDPISASFMINLAYELYPLWQQQQRGQLTLDEFKAQAETAILQRASLALCSLGGQSLIGPAGRLLPWLIQLIESSDSKQQLAQLFQLWSRVIQTAKPTQPLPRQSQALLRQPKPVKQLNFHQELVSHMDSFDIDFDQPSPSDMSSASEQPNQIEQATQGFIIQKAQQRPQLEIAALQAAQLLADNGQNPPGPIQHFLQNLGLTPPTQPEAAQDMAQTAALSLLQALQSEQNLSLEFLNLLQLRLHGLAEQLSQKAHQPYSQLASHYLKQRNQLIERNQQLGSLELRPELQQWLNQGDNTDDYSQQPPLLRLLRVVNEFIHLTQSQWTTNELLSLQTMYQRVGLSELQFSLPQLSHELVKIASARGQLLQQLKLIPAQYGYQRLDSVHWISQLHQDQLTEQQPPTGLQLWPGKPLLSTWELALVLLWHLKAAGLSPVRTNEISSLKQQWQSQLEQLEQLIAQQILPDALQTEVDQLKAAIQAYHLKVPLIGKFSVGKSSLINAWLGTELQAKDLGACTSVPTELHYAELADQRLVVARYQNSANSQSQHLDYQQLPISDYQPQLLSQLAQPETIAHFKLFLHLPALACYPDLVLVDTPGLESSVGAHEQALSQYIGEGVAYILCVNQSQLGEPERRFVERQQDLGQMVSVLVCQEDLIPRSQRAAVRDTIGQQARLLEHELVRGCSASHFDLSGFADILNHLERQKLPLFRQHFEQPVKQLISNAERLLNQLLTSTDNSASLHNQQQALQEGMQQLEQRYQREQDRITSRLHDLTSNLLNQISNHLRFRLDTYSNALLNNEPAHQLMSADIQNAYQLSCAQELDSFIVQINKNLQLELSHNQQAQLDIQLNEFLNVGSNLTAIGGAVGGGLVALHLIAPPVMLLTLAAGFVMGQSQKTERAKQQILSCIDQLDSQLRPSIQQDLEQLLNSLLQQAYQQVHQRLQAEQQKIDLLQQQLHHSQQQRQRHQQQVETALSSLRQLLQAQTQLVIA